MKLLELISFNPGWFLTKEGILITFGVILLLVAFILLLTSFKKENKEENKDENIKQPNSTDVGSTTPVVPTQAPQQPEQIVVPTVENQQALNNEPVVNNEEAKLEIFEPVSDNHIPVQNAEPVIETPVVNVPVTNEPIINDVVNNQVMDAPTSSEPAVMNNAPVLEINSDPTVDNSNANANINETPVINEEKPAVSIYGGVSPKTDLYKNESHEKPVIYGGADPLENTTPMPRVDGTMLYNEPLMQDDTRIIEPVQDIKVPSQTAVMDNSVVDTISAEPVVEQIIEPVVENPTTSPLFAEAESTPVQANVEQINPQPVASEEIEMLDF